jgi:hypothetical protein
MKLTNLTHPAGNEKVETQPGRARTASAFSFKSDMTDRPGDSTIAPPSS